MFKWIVTKIRMQGVIQKRHKMLSGIENSCPNLPFWVRNFLFPPKKTQIVWDFSQGPGVGHFLGLLAVNHPRTLEVGLPQEATVASPVEGGSPPANPEQARGGPHVLLVRSLVQPPPLPPLPPPLGEPAPERLGRVGLGPSGGQLGGRGRLHQVLVDQLHVLADWGGSWDADARRAARCAHHARCVHRSPFALCASGTLRTH